MITYRRTKSDEWVAYGPAAEVRLGLIAITRKDGAASYREVVRVGRSFEVQGVLHCYGYLADELPRSHSHVDAGTLQPQDRESGPCANCGLGRGVVMRRDSSGIGGLVCQRCSRDASYELSFA